MTKCDCEHNRMLETTSDANNFIDKKNQKRKYYYQKRSKNYIIRPTGEEKL